jgi:hypothetical protein
MREGGDPLGIEGQTDRITENTTSYQGVVGHGAIVTIAMKFGPLGKTWFPATTAPPARNSCQNHLGACFQ